MPLAYEESTFEYPDVTLAWEDDPLGDITQKEDASFTFIVSY